MRVIPTTPRPAIGSLLPRALCGAWLLLTLALPVAADTLFVSVFTGGSIQRFDLPSDTPIEIVRGLDHPEDGACSPDGFIYFAESLAHRITRWQQDGADPTDIVPAAGFVYGPEGLAFDDAGNLFFNTREIGFATLGAFRLLDADPVRGLEQIVPPYTGFGEGTDIVVAGPHAGALLLVARGEAQIWRSEPPGAPLELVIDTPAFPSGSSLFGVATDGCGEIFVSFAAPAASAGPSEVHHFDPEGNFIEVYADGFQRAAFLEFDSAGDLYVADSDGGAVYRIEPDRTRSVFQFLPDGPIGLAMCRDLRVPACGLTCEAGGPYLIECAGPTTCVDLDGSGSGDSTGAPVILGWESDCPGATFSDPTSPTPTLCLDVEPDDCEVACTATLTVSRGGTSESCTSDVRVEDTQPPLLADCALIPPLDPAPPRPAASASSATSRRSLTVACGMAVDACDPAPLVDAQLVVTRHRLESGTCVETTEALPVDCGEVLDLVELIPPCPVSPPPSPRSPRPTVSVRSDGTRVISGEEFRLEVLADDACGHETTCTASPSERVSLR